MTALLVEAKEKESTETGGVFLGKYEDGIWYVVETIDPGPNSIFQYAYFEYDQDYINHLINKISRLYKNQLDLIGLWHRHPGSLDTFSATDDGTNTQYAELSKFGAISGLVNIDPDFRLTIYHVDLPLSYQKIEYSIDDDRIPDHISELKDPYVYSKELSQTQNNINTYDFKSFSSLLEKNKLNIISGINKYIKGKTIFTIKKIADIDFESDYPLERILETLESDLLFFNESGISYSIKIGETGLLELLLSDENSSVHLSFGMDKDNTIAFVHEGMFYQYQKGLFAKALKAKGRRT